MKIIFIKRKTIINISFVLLVLLVSIIYTKGPGKGVIGAFLNNEKVMPIYSVDIPDRRIALTFDADWGDESVPGIMEVLKRYNIKATFFLRGTWIDKHNDLVKTIYEQGYEIGNHSNTHVKMIQLQKNTIINEIKETETKLQKITGQKPVLFRAPFGEYDDKLIETVRGLKYNVIQWDVDSLDWKGSSEGDIYNRVTSKVNGGSVVLFHTGSANTIKALPQIIEKLRKDGYKFINVSELLLKENCYIDNMGRQRPLD